MTEKEINDTKIKILDVARVLFANHGFEGTSIRDIAKAAEVNVASVNYHFSNKEKLFTEILQAGYVACSEELRVMYERDNPTLEDTLVYLYRNFTSNSHDLISFMKMMMSTQHSHHQTSHGTEDEFYGPPGGKLIAGAIMKEVGKQVPEEDLHFALKTLFSHVVHHAIMYSCCFKTNNNIPYTSQEDIEKNIRRLTRLVLKDLKG